MKLTIFSVLAITTLACGSEALPPLGDDPSVADIEKHAALHCAKVQSCAPGEPVYAECMEKMQSHVSTREDRRVTGVHLIRFEPCLAMDCVPMTICFSKVALDPWPPSARAPKTPAASASTSR